MLQEGAFSVSLLVSYSGFQLPIGEFYSEQELSVLGISSPSDFRVPHWVPRSAGLFDHSFQASSFSSDITFSGSLFLQTLTELSVSPQGSYGILSNFIWVHVVLGGLCWFICLLECKVLESRKLLPSQSLQLLAWYVVVWLCKLLNLL